MSSSVVTFDASVVACASAEAGFPELALLRKSLPLQSAGRVPNHFLKHADEQTVLALEAMRRAVEMYDVDLATQESWGIVGAPRYIGRMAGNDILAGFARGGGDTVATHAAAQFSLNSIPGAASIFFGIRGPSVGVGGGIWSIADAFVSGRTLFDPAATPGVWLIMTQWSPEPIVNTPPEQNAHANCHAVAIAIAPDVQGESSMSLSMPCAGAAVAPPRFAIDEPTVAQLAAQLAHTYPGGRANWSRRLPCGSSVQLSVASRAGRLRVAA